MKKKLFLLLLSAVIVLGMIPYMAFADSDTLSTLGGSATASIVDSGTCGSSLAWRLDSEGVLTISGSGMMTISGNTPPWDSHITDIKSVVINDGAIVISDYAFRGSTSLTSVTIPKSVTAIGNYAFYNCKALSAVIYAGDETAWSQVTIGSNNPKLSSATKTYLNQTTTTTTTTPEDTIGSTLSGSVGGDSTIGGSLGGDSTIGGSLGGDSTIGGSVGGDSTIGGSVGGDSTIGGTTLGGGDETVPAGYAASGSCGDDLTWTLNSEGVLTISGTGAMQFSSYASAPWKDYLSSVKSVVINEGMTQICSNAFADCTNLTSVKIPKSVTQIYSFAFNNCPYGLTVYYAGTEADWAKIGGVDETFNSNLYYAIKQYASSAATGDSCGDNLTWSLDENGTLTISGTGQALNEGAFKDRTDIKKVVFNTGVSFWTVSQDSFANCTNLTTVKLAAGIGTLESGAFSGCTSLKAIEIPLSVSSIAENCFKGTALKDVYYTGADSMWDSKLNNPNGSKISTVGNEQLLEKATFHYDSNLPDDYKADEGNSGNLGGDNIGDGNPGGGNLGGDNIGGNLGGDDIHTHTPGAATRENEVAATCTKEGSYDEVVKCTVCGNEISRTSKTIDKIAHTVVTDEAVAATCTTSGKTAGSHCSVCGTVIEAQIEIAATGNHTYGDWAITKAATATAAGEQTRTCSVCGDKQTEAIPNTTQTTLAELNKKDNVTPAEVREALKYTTTAELSTAISADKGEADGVVSQLEALEAKTGINTEIESGIDTFAKQNVKIVGAALNVTSDADTVTLKIVAAEGSPAIADTYDSNKAVKFSMDLVGVDTTKTLTIPVKVTLPVPSDIDSTKLVILHYASGGTVSETLQGDKLQITGNSSQYYVSFTLDHFSDFVMTQIKTTIPVAGGGGGGGGAVTTTYTVTAATATNGKITVSPTSAAKGAAVTITATPNSGYAVDKITATDANGSSVTVTENNGKYTFTMPAAKVTVTATFKAADQTSTTVKNILGSVAVKFKDVVSGAWYEAAVNYAQEKGLMNGETESEFHPNNNMTRAMLMTVLARLDGADTTGGSTWYEKAMNWAKEKEVSDGSDPNGNITREQLATMLYRYAGTPEATGTTTSFKDSAKISAYAAEAMNWAVGAGLLNGNDDNTLNPGGNATRAEVATILMRFCENFNK
jgi:hypothetical protein